MQPSHPFTSLSRKVEQWTRPSAAIVELEEAQQARLLAAVSLALLLFLPVVSAIWVVVMPEFDSTRLITLALWLTIGLAYGLSRTPAYRKGALTLVTAFLLAIAVSLVISPSSPTERMLALSYLVIIYKLATLFLRSAERWGVTAVSLGLISIFLFIPGGSTAHALAYLLFFLLAVILEAIGAALGQHHKRQLADSATLYRSLVAALSEGVVVRQKEGDILSANAAAERILGLTADQMMGQAADSGWQFTREDGAPLSDAEHPAAVTLRTGQPSHNVVIGARRDEEQRWLAVNSQPLTRPDEELPYAVVATFRDITERKQTEESLRQSEARWRAMLAAMPDMIFRLRADGVYLDYHAPNPKLLFLPPEQFLGKKLTEILPGTLADQQIALVQQAVESGEMALLEYSAPVSGEWGHFEARIVPIGSGREEALAIVRDMTSLKQARQQLEEAQARLEFAVEAARLAWWEMDVNTGRIQFDPRKALMAGYAPEAFANATYHAFTDLVHPDDYKPMMEAMHQAITGQSPLYSADYRLKTAVGDWLWFHDHGALLEEEGRKIMRGFVLDISARKEAQQRELDLKLERERVQMLTDFIRNASHEFRTPLSIINTTAFVMARLPDREERQEKVLFIQEQVQRIARLLDMLLTIVKLENQTTIPQQKVDMNSLFSLACRRARDARKQDSIICGQLSEPLPTVQGDEQALNEALRHILDNALRFTPAQGEIRLFAGVDEGYVWIEVQDTGPGIPTDDQARVFETFWREDEAHSTPGFGLGLTIADKIISLHKGEIKLTSQVGVGSTFRVMLPTTS